MHIAAAVPKRVVILGFENGNNILEPPSLIEYRIRPQIRPLSPVMTSVLFLLCLLKGRQEGNLVTTTLATFEPPSRQTWGDVRRIRIR
jgi:hypothetical protein